MNALRGFFGAFGSFLAFVFVGLDFLVAAFGIFGVAWEK